MEGQLTISVGLFSLRVWSVFPIVNETLRPESATHRRPVVRANQRSASSWYVCERVAPRFVDVGHVAPAQVGLPLSSTLSVV